MEASVEPKITEVVAVPDSVKESQEKPKKIRTEAQQAATQKALAAMTIARKERAVKQREKKEEVKIAKQVIEKKIVNENISFVTKAEFDTMKKELTDLRALTHAVKEVKDAKAVPLQKQERIVERVFERVPTQVAAPSKLSGHALLDRLFFEK